MSFASNARAPRDGRAIDLHQKHKPGDAYDPQAFVDKAGYYEKIKELEAAYQKKLQQM